jgi:hypothetical protein
LGQAPSGDVWDCVTPRCRVRATSAVAVRVDGALLTAVTLTNAVTTGCASRLIRQDYKTSDASALAAKNVEVSRWRRGGFTLREATAVVLGVKWPLAIVAVKHGWSVRHLRLNKHGVVKRCYRTARGVTAASHVHDRRSVVGVGCFHAVPWGNQREGTPRAFGVAEGWQTESPGETIRNYANLIARVNIIFETVRSSVLGLPRIVRRPTASR